MIPGLPLAFAQPLVLLALIGLPLLWWLLRLVPPRPRRVAFPPTRLLFDIAPKEETPARTPWWLTLLRLMLAQNHLLSTTLRAQIENAALVERLHRQMELTARASREKSQFLASASHDLRQPLHALSFFGATLERRMAGSIDQPLIYNIMRSIEALDK